MAAEPQPGEPAVLTLSPAASRTEQRNPRTIDIDRVPTEEVLRLLNAEDATVAGGVAPALPVLAIVVDGVVERLRGGGRVHYFGAGTSGRMAVLDAAEVVPTFGLERGVFVAHHAGGDLALGAAVENAEDDEALGAQKILLNALSTAAMIQLGRAYSNLMVALSGTNSKLRHRQLAILREATGASDEACRAELARCGGDLRLALLCLLAGLEPESAAVTLAAAGGSVRAALSAAGTEIVMSDNPIPNECRPAG